ncbi:helix-turn-helix domain-containing protein [Streptomyces sp. NBC_00572]|uniref:helix-turn-helix domain-containing protein n=1 Tax=Streptomyces sp. NBC_00572 TaxID=2903664 RepID=UPI002250C08B|nr:helix-turn-helix domain-containing protein [Streptomyces sp. NBC_00572]MCX4982555.1 helix-turn-helix domain-containing protein [Streptomyces sp. NBC_00572]
MSRNAAVSRVGSEQALAVYQELRARPGTAFDEAADRLELTAEERERCREELASLGLTAPQDPSEPDAPQDASGPGTPRGPETRARSLVPTVVDPDVALLRLLRRERDRLQDRLAATSRAHTALEALAGPFLRAGAAPRSEVEVEIVTDPQRVLRELTELTESVRTAVHVMHTGSVRREDMAAELDRDRRRADRGVRVRAMYSRRVGTVPEMTQHLADRAALGVELRLSPVVPMNMVLADENFALLPTDPHDPDSPTILARGPGLVRSYLALYEYCWQAAARYGEEPRESGGDGLSDQQRAALHMLASGIKDEQIARSLGVSLRTVSRLLSEVMQELGAASRFEAGVKAARLGLLDGEGSEQGV